MTNIQSNHPQAYVLLGAGAEQYARWIENETEWLLCGNCSAVLEHVNHAKHFFSALTDLEIQFPAVSYNDKPETETRSWLFKYSNTCGGVGVHRNPPFNNPNAVGYWQQEIIGQSISALFITDGKQAECIGINQMHSYEMDVNHPYVYQGVSINKLVDDDIKYKTISYAESIIKHFKLIGVFSIDMLLSDDGIEPRLYVLEVNARISASYELYERVNPGLNLVDEHIRVCEGERLSKLMLNKAVSAYSIVYTRSDCQIKAGIDWPVWCKDIPETGRRILSGEPLCSVYTEQQEGDIQTLLYEREQEILNIINQ